MKIILALGLTALAAPALAQTAGDPVMGAKQFGQCRVCHANVANRPDSVGPNLWGVYGSKAATLRAKFGYSPALRGSKIVWTDATLDPWLADPQALVKGSKMAFIGFPSKRVRQNVIAYLKTLK